MPSKGRQKIRKMIYLYLFSVKVAKMWTLTGPEGGWYF